MKWKENQDNDYYIRCFNDQVLNKLNPTRVYQELCSLAKSDEFALICYEEPADFCHRHLVADWFKSAELDAMEYPFDDNGIL